MSEEVSIIIQGPTIYYRDIVKKYKNNKNILWCTWDDEPKDVLNFIEKEGLKIHLIKKPLTPGYWNINFQCKSTYEGLIKCNQLYNTKFYLKLRSDFIISDLDLLCQRFILKNESINFLGWAEILGGFFPDYIVFGDYECMLKFWKLYPDSNNNGYPCPEIYLNQRFFGTSLSPTILNKLYKDKYPILDGIDIYWISRKLNIRDFSDKVILNYNDNISYYKVKFFLKKIKSKLLNILN
jgi:hypothetical protein